MRAELRPKPVPVSNELAMTVTDDIDRISPRMWDAHLDPNDLQASHRFVRVCQRSGVEDATYRHVLITRDGHTVATASLTCLHVRLELLAGPAVRRLVAASRRLHPSLLRIPMVLGGLPVSFGQSCLRVAPGEDPAPLLARIDAEAERFAASQGAGLICFKEMSSAEARVADGLCRVGYFRAPSLPSCRLDLPFDDLQELLDAMRSGYRRQLHQTERVCEEKDLTVRRVDDWEGLESTLFELYERVMDRAEYQMERLNREFFRELRIAFGDRARVITVEREGGEMLAYAIMLHGVQHSTFLIAGIRYSRPEALLAYRRVVKETVVDALRQGADRLEMGQTSYGTKTRLGAKSNPRYLYFRHRHPLFHRLLRSVRGVLFPDRTIAPRRVFREA
jgi:hypothetical protein